MTNNVREVRRRLGWTQKKLAAECGLQSQDISNVECGHRCYPAWRRRIADALRRDEEELFPACEDERVPA